MMLSILSGIKEKAEHLSPTRMNTGREKDRVRKPAWEAAIPRCIFLPPALQKRAETEANP
jgi:hypothetical protein